MTTELILQKIQERKATHTKDFVEFSKVENANVDDLYPIVVRIDELDQVIEIVKKCIAETEDNGK